MMMTEKKKRRKKKSNYYFTKVHEQAIIDYALTDDRDIKTKLYINFIQPAFNEMVDKIVYTYKFNNLPNIDYLKDDCKIWLTTILDKYDPSKKSKAFSYFSVITKNWFIHKVKYNSKRLRREVVIDNTPITAEEENFVVNNEYLNNREKDEFWSHLMGEMDIWEKLKLKENEKKVLKAIRVLFESSEDIEIFNKKAIYLYIRELTSLNTKQVVNNLNKIRSKYRSFRKKWDEGQI
jgi:hypothetical protein